jgi:hypothetical protein
LSSTYWSAVQRWLSDRAHEKNRAWQEVSAASVVDVDGLGVTAVGAREEESQGVFPLGDNHEVDVVRHQAVGEDLDVGLSEVVADEAEVEMAVGDGEEDLLAVGPALT